MRVLNTADQVCLAVCGTPIEMNREIRTSGHSVLCGRQEAGRNPTR